MDTDPEPGEVLCTFLRPTKVRTMEFGAGGRVMAVEAEVIVTAFPSDSSQRSLIVRGHLILLSQKLDGPWEVSPYPIAD